MAITSLDIQNQSFSIDRKGYDVDEVDIFLEHVADEIDILNNRIAELEDALEEAKAAGAAANAGAGSGEDPFAPTTTPETSDAALDSKGASGTAAAEAAALNEEQEKRIDELEKQLNEKRANDSAISQALIIAQRTADDTIARAEVEAEGIINAAKEKADEIVAGANADKQDIINESKQLDTECEEIRGRFQDMLKDFINDATNKLADISDASLMASAHARRDALEASSSVAAQASAQSYVTPVLEGGDAPVATAAVAHASATPERDLSGFGDAEINDIDIDD